MLASKNNEVKQTKVLQFGFPDVPQFQRISIPVKI